MPLCLGYTSRGGQPFHCLMSNLASVLTLSFSCFRNLETTAPHFNSCNIGTVTGAFASARRTSAIASGASALVKAFTRPRTSSIRLCMRVAASMGWNEFGLKGAGLERL